MNRFFKPDTSFDYKLKYIFGIIPDKLLLNKSDFF